MHFKRQDFRERERDRSFRGQSVDYKLPSMLIMDYLSSFNLYLLIQPLAVTAALGPTLGGAAGGAGVEAPQAVLIQAVAEVHAAQD